VDAIFVLADTEREHFGLDGDDAVEAPGGVTDA
jgi:hypothetical protein